MKCICPGGASKPSADYDQIQQLITAAQYRHATTQAAQKAENVKKQGEVAADRSKRKDAKANAQVDELGNEYEGLSGVRTCRFATKV